LEGGEDFAAAELGGASSRESFQVFLVAEGLEPVEFDGPEDDNGATTMLMGVWMRSSSVRRWDGPA
jgi:hypothetical protein